MTQAVLAWMLLFNGANLDGWNALHGSWDVSERILHACSERAVLRSSFESPEYVLEFKYLCGKRPASLFVHSGFDGGGYELRLTGKGAVAPDEATAQGGGRWITVRAEVGPGLIRATSVSEDGQKLADTSVKTPETARGFLRFESPEPGLRLYGIRAAEPGFAPMFKSGSLDGWEVFNQKKNIKDPDWYVQEGTVVCRGQGYGNWLKTLRKYDNFVLRVEYWLPRGGNSGIYLRAPVAGRISQTGMELQLIDEINWKGKPLQPSQRTGSIYSGMAPEAKSPAPPESWNAIEVRLDGQQVRTTLNGVQLYDNSLDDESKDAKLLGYAIKGRPLSGFLGLQDHTGGPKFRNVRIMELKAQPTSEAASQPS
jgi:hypothetical protein